MHIGDIIRANKVNKRLHSKEHLLAEDISRLMHEPKNLRHI